MMTRIVAFSVFAIWLICSCKEEEMQVGIPENEKFELHLDLLRNNYNHFVIASNDEGEIVFDTLLSDYEGVRMIDIPKDEKLNITYGFQFTQSSFAIYTYANVKSGFKCTSLIRGCGELFNRLVSHDRIKLVIRNVPELDSVFYPFFNKFDPYELDDGNLVLSGSIYENYDHLITLKPTSSTRNYKSYLLPYNELDSDQDTIYHEVDYSDFENPEIRYINMSYDRKWIVDVTGAKSGEGFVHLADFDVQTGSSIRIFNLADLSIDRYLFDVKNANSIDGFQSRKLESSIPKEITLVDSDVDIISKSAKAFEIKTDGTANLVRVEYEYRIGQALSYWTVYNFEQKEIKLSLPTIPEYLVRENPLMTVVGESPRRFIVRSLIIDDFNEEDFHSSSINHEARCKEFVSRTVSMDF